MIENLLDFLKIHRRLHFESWGDEHPNDRFLVIRRSDLRAGLFSHFLTMLGWLRYAESKKLIPVVDLSAKSLYKMNGHTEEVNIWDMFFEQPRGIGMADIRQAKHVLVAEEFPVLRRHFFPDPTGGSFFDENGDECRNWRKLVRSGIRVRADVLFASRNEEFELALPNGVLGVYARGTDYVTMRPSRHPIQPTVEMIAERVDVVLAENSKFKMIYLVTEDRIMAEYLMMCFPGRIILSRQSFVDYKGGYLCEATDVRNNIRRGTEYLRAIVDLSRCQGLIAGRTSGSLAAQLLSNGFDYSHFFDLGLYP